MKKLLVCLGLLLLVPGLALAQDSTNSNDPAGFPVGYFVTYFSNNVGPSTTAPDQSIRIINTGTLGTPLTSPVGDLCANIYVFDNNQEMIACCAERITPNELDSASVGNQLTSNPLTAVVPVSGVIKVITTLVPTGGCNPAGLPVQSAALFPFVDADMYSTHLQVTAGKTYVTETLSEGSLLLNTTSATAEYNFLQQACSFTLYLGSGKGTCSSSVPGH
jgi:hypothetical protein